MKTNEMIELLKGGAVKVIDENQLEYTITHTCNNTNTYFWRGGFYSAYRNIDDCNEYRQLEKLLSQIIRIEKYIDSEYYPIWTKEDGLITQTEHFVKLHDRYYTISFLEKLIDKVKEFKKINL